MVAHIYIYIHKYSAFMQIHSTYMPVPVRYGTKDKQLYIIHRTSYLRTNFGHIFSFSHDRHARKSGISANNDTLPFTWYSTIHVMYRTSYIV